MNHKPLVSIIILNYFGEKVIQKTVTSILHSTEPVDNYEIIIVDNHSHDQSQTIIKKLARQHHNIRYLFLEKNFGFAKGNNLGIKIAKGEYIALLNNDCLVSPTWMSSLIAVAKSIPNAFAIASKILLYPKFFDLNLNTLGTVNRCMITKSKLNDYSNQKIILPLKPSNASKVISIPYDPAYDKTIVLKITTFNPPKLIKLPPQLALLAKKKVKTNFEITVKINIDKQIQKKSYRKIQNAGSIVFQDGYSRDIGADIHDQRQDYEIDTGQFSNNRHVYSFCGAAVLLKKDILNKLGNLNESFFMYYEDTDLSEKARLNGHDIIYCAKAEVYHLHALSSKEWSKFFIYQVERGRLLHLAHNFPLKVFLQKLLAFTYRSILKIFVNQPTDFLATLSIISSLPKLILYRLQLPPKTKLSIQHNYQKILDGYWLFQKNET